MTPHCQNACLCRKTRVHFVTTKLCGRGVVPSGVQGQNIETPENNGAMTKTDLW